MRDNRYYSGGNDKYELDIISHHHASEGKPLVKHFVDNIDTVGAWGEEAFEIRVKNNTNERIQVKLSLDGTDVLTGEKASARAYGKMWVIGPRGTLNLSAWPEDTEKGARFIFGKTANSVAANTHGDLSSKGIISAAIFTEGYVEPPRVYYQGFLGDSWGRRTPIRARTQMDARAETKSAKSLSMDVDCAPAGAAEFMREIMDGPAVGAGETIRQKIGSAQGLRDPRFDRILSLRYLWWDDLKAKLDRQSPVHSSGFVDAPPPQKLANLGKTPRIERVHSA